MNDSIKIQNLNKINPSEILKMSTFSIDNMLPSLPLPDLDKTLNKYLESVKPFVTEIELLNTQKKLDTFKNGIGKKLNFLLVEKAKRERNWLENWWLDWAYLEWREPIIPYINTTGYLVQDFPSDESIKNLEKQNIDIQAAEASISIYLFNKFFEELRNETFPIQKSRSEYFSMDQYRRLFNTCRIPSKDKDKLITHFKTANEGNCPTHVIVIYKNRFYKIETYTNDQRFLNVGEIYDQIVSILDRSNPKSNGVGIGALTADLRDSWAQNRQYLIDLSGVNEKNLELIEKSLYVVVLEDEDAKNLNDMPNLALLGNPKNRFYDKSYQMIICKNGVVGSNIEHSAFDGMVSGTVSGYSLDERKKLNLEPVKIKTYARSQNLKKPEELEFVYDLKIENEIKKTTNLFENNASEIELRTLVVQSCTKDKLKSYKINPDTFTQMCMQLSYYQIHNKPAPTYETATTRGYFHGRTETVRSCSHEAIEWCKAMCNKDKSSRLNDSEFLKLFKIACNKHDSLMNDARQNSGCDRHLLGLLLISRSLNLETPDIYTDPSWTKSGGGGNFLISSSCVGYSNILGTCAPFCLNGYTMIYCFSEQGLSFGIARYKKSTETNMDKINDSLTSAILQVQKLFELNSKL